MAKTNSIEIELARALEEYEEDLRDIVDNTIKEVADDAAEKLRSTSPRRPGGGTYAAGWVAEKQAAGAYVVRNKDAPQLTHLLENSHVIRNKHGSYGRTGPGHGQIVHIKPVEQWANAELPDRIERNLQK